MLFQEDYFKNIYNTVREGILILDENMRVLSVNRSFLNIFKVDIADTTGSLLYDLGNGQWNIPELRMLLEDILPKNDIVREEINSITNIVFIGKPINTRAFAKETVNLSGEFSHILKSQIQQR